MRSGEAAQPTGNRRRNCGPPGQPRQRQVAMATELCAELPGCPAEGGYGGAEGVGCHKDTASPVRLLNAAARFSASTLAASPQTSMPKFPLANEPLKRNILRL